MSRAWAPSQPPSAPPDLTHTHAFDVAFSDFYSPDEETLAANRAVVERFGSRPSSIRSATWFVPYFEHTYFGGIYTILRFMRWLKLERSVENRIVMYDHPSLTDARVRSAISDTFPDLADIDIVVPPKGRAPFVDFTELPESDIALATIWYSAYALLRFNATKAKFYFVQDFEPAFYPAGTLYGVAEATYRFGFAGLVNTPGLADVYRSYGNPAATFVPAVDWARDESFRPRSDTHPVQVVIYGRPGTDRNAFELLAATCHRVKERLGDQVRIVSVGENWEPDKYHLSGIVENLGLLENLTKVRDLYRSSDIGVSCMFSKHPSYQPFEYLSSGMAVVTNQNAATGWFFHHEENCLLSEPFASTMSAAIIRLVEEPELRAKLAANGHSFVSQSSWDTEFPKLWNFMTGQEPQLDKPEA